MSPFGYEPPWTGIIETQPSPLEIHALITPPELLHMASRPEESHPQALCDNSEVGVTRLEGQQLSRLPYPLPCRRHL